MRIFYTISIHIYGLLIQILQYINPKAKLWLSGRKDVWTGLRKAIPHDRAVVWFHASSLGEFEQGRPLIEALRESNKNVFILLTFFSPSGYVVHKNYAQADYVTYIPLDTYTNANRFIRITHPEIAFFVKYDFWFNHLAALKNHRCRVFLVSGIFRPSQHFFKPWGWWFRKNLDVFEHFFVQDERSLKLLHSIGYSNSLLSGDTRFDRVVRIRDNAAGNPLIAAFAQSQPLIVAGSTWYQDEVILQKMYCSIPGIRLLIAPHEIHEAHIARLMKLFEGKTVRFSSLSTEKTPPEADVLIVDTMGMLSSLYRYGRIAYIGGGFGKGIHNILEAACYGIPVVFGPNHEKFREAHDLIRVGAAFSFSTEKEILHYLKTLLGDEQIYRKAAEAATEYIREQTGATQRILAYLSGSVKR